jgi:polyhydroxybutyrate depolymerase
MVDDIQRSYILYIPETLPENAPLVMVFHGYSGSAAYARSYFNLEKLADAHGFALVYPQGTKDQTGYRFWQVGYSSHSSLKVNDVTFTTTLADHLQSTFGLSVENTFIVGFSNGGDLCNKLICETSGRFKAAAPIISCMMQDMYDACTNSPAVPVLMLNGTKDDITYWAGDMENKQGYGPYHSTDSMLAFRVKQSKSVLASTDTIESPKADDNTSITIKKYLNETTKNQVWMYQVNNGGHGHPDYLNLEEEVWSFFSMFIDN